MKKLLLIISISPLAFSQSSGLINHGTSGELSSGSNNAVRIMADQAPGSDGGDKINQAIASAPACTSSKLGGNCPYVIDATELAGVQSGAATINCNKPDVTILFGPSHWTLAGSPGIALSAFGCKLEGLDRTQTILDTSSSVARWCPKLPIAAVGAARLTSFCRFRAYIRELHN